MTKITIEPPCNVGDLLFCIFSYSSSYKKIEYIIHPCRVDYWQYFSNGRFNISVESINNGTGRYVTIGEDAFWTCEEAEEKLLELRGDK